jgi:hypothetical protein
MDPDWTPGQGSSSSEAGLDPPIAEIKSITARNDVSQLQRGLGQILHNVGSTTPLSSGTTGPGTTGPADDP